jgi:hypothetical protein
MLDGIATMDGTVRQFVAMPYGSAYSVQGQVTGQEVTGEMQFEVTPHDMSQYIVITVGMLWGMRPHFSVPRDYTVKRL